MGETRIAIFFRSRQVQGSGYFLTDRQVLTARHVVGGVGTRCQVQALGSRKRPARGQVTWEDAALDAAIVELASPFLSEPSPLPDFGIVPESGAEVVTEAVGFPQARTDNAEFRVKATLRWIVLREAVQVAIPDLAPDDWKEGWAGFSGAALIGNGQLFGVVTDVEGPWGGRLLVAVATQQLFDSPGFMDAIGVAEADRGRYLTAYDPDGADLVDKVLSQRSFVDRADVIGSIRAHLDELADTGDSRPRCFSIVGHLHDEHIDFVNRLATDDAIARLVGSKGALSAVRKLTWPKLPSIISDPKWKWEASKLFHEFLASIELDKNDVPRLDTDVAGAARAVRRHLDQQKLKRAFYIQINRPLMGEGHGELLERWLDFWSQLGEGVPIVLFIGIIWRGSAAPPELPDDIGSPVAFTVDRRVQEALQRARHKKWMEALPNFEAITLDHIDSWVDELRKGSGEARKSWFDHLRRRIGDEMRRQEDEMSREEGEVRMRQFWTCLDYALGRRER